MAPIKLTKIEIKKKLRDELQCDYGFIKYLTKWGVISKLQEAYADENESDAYSKEVMDEIYDAYKEYCEVWDLDYEADNRNNKDYLKTDISKRIVIPPLDDEMKRKLTKQRNERKK